MTDLIRDDDLVKLLEDGANVVEESWDGLANIDDMVEWVKRARAALSVIRSDSSTACSTAAAPISQSNNHADTVSAEAPEKVTQTE
jgi:hypothetical protein